LCRLGTRVFHPSGIETPNPTSQPQSGRSQVVCHGSVEPDCWTSVNRTGGSSSRVDAWPDVRLLVLGVAMIPPGEDAAAELVVGIREGAQGGSPARSDRRWLGCGRIGSLPITCGSRGSLAAIEPGIDVAMSAAAGRIFA
jgi:hypothetical protein